MARAQKLASGTWRCQVYSHKEPIFDEQGFPVLDENGEQKQKRIYRSFTSDIPGIKGKRAAERAAAEWADGKDRISHTASLTVGEAIDKYIEESSAVLSPTTIQGYRRIQKVAFKDLLDIKLYQLTNATLSEAVSAESRRPARSNHKNSRYISPKTVHNEYGLLTAVLNRYMPGLNCKVSLPQIPETFPDLLEPDVIFRIVKGSDIELAVLLAVWLSFSRSEILGLTKSSSIKGDYITVKEVVVSVDNKECRKNTGKNRKRQRTHRIPPYIKKLIDATDPAEDRLVPMTGSMLYHKWANLLKKNGLPHMRFHDLRHVNASVMAMLKIPDKYAQERGGWSSNYVMKGVYTQAFDSARIAVDDTIDEYFEEVMQHEMQHGIKKTL